MTALNSIFYICTRALHSFLSFALSRSLHHYPSAAQSRLHTIHPTKPWSTPYPPSTYIRHQHPSSHATHLFSPRAQTGEVPSNIWLYMADGIWLKAYSTSSHSPYGEVTSAISMIILSQTLINCMNISKLYIKIKLMYIVVYYFCNLAFYDDLILISVVIW